MRARRVIIAALGLATTTVALIGVMHLPFARGLLMKAGGCPVGNASVAEIEPTRQKLIRESRGTDPAPARPALGFQLDATTHADVAAWADKVGVACHEEREGLTFCAEVPARALGLPDADGPVSEVHFGFNTRGVLVDVATMRMNTSARPALDIQARLEATVGKPQQSNGGFEEETLARPVSHLSYKFKDYMAELTAMRMPSTGLVVREHYLSARD